MRTSYRGVMIAALVMAAAPARADMLSDLLGGFSDSHAATRAAQPSWSSPMVTTTGLLEQRLRLDVAHQHSGNGAETTQLDNSRGLDLIVGDSQEIQVALPSYTFRRTPGAPGQAGFSDGAVFRLEQRLASSPASGGDYVLTAWLQVQAPSGIKSFTNGAWALQPTVAFGKGWGRFDIQGTLSGTLPTARLSVLGNQFQSNTAFQYHLGDLFWPEVEVNWTHWSGGQRDGLDQIYLTPGLVVGRFALSQALKFTFGVGYQMAVSPSYRPKPLTPAYDHALLFSSRVNF